MKNPIGFMKIVVICVLVSMPLFAAIFVILQLTTGLDPSPYLTFLAPLGAVELIMTAALEWVQRYTKNKYVNETEEESEEENDTTT